MIIKTRFLPNNVIGMTLYPFILIRPKYENDKKLLNHEKIHLVQQKELLVIGFYFLYLAEWLYKTLTTKDAYINISFEREAYDNENDMLYLDNRKKYSWTKYI